MTMRFACATTLTTLALLAGSAAAQAPEIDPAGGPSNQLAVGRKIRVTLGTGAYRIRETGTLHALSGDTLVLELPTREQHILLRPSTTSIEVGRRTGPSPLPVLRSTLAFSAGAVIMDGLIYAIFNEALADNKMLEAKPPDYARGALIGAAIGLAYGLAKGSVRWEPAAP